jgi:DNA-binding CsgD family transcriptional regulator
MRAVERQAAAAATPSRRRAARIPGLVEALTERELQVLRRLAAGKPNRQIADELYVSLDSVKRHVTHILGKLGATNRTQATARARALGLLVAAAEPRTPPGPDSRGHIGLHPPRPGASSHRGFHLRVTKHDGSAPTVVLASPDASGRRARCRMPSSDTTSPRAAS